MMDLDERCPVCGGTTYYYINSYGQIVKQCDKCKHIIANDVVTTNKTTFTGYYTQSTTVTNISLQKLCKDADEKDKRREL